FKFKINNISYQRMKRTFDVIVIGCGASGLAAAKELEKRIESYLILEGSDRVGGRIKTIDTPSGGFIDIGAQWIHGQKDNYLYDFAAPLGLVGERVSVDGEGDFYTDKHELLNESLVSEVLGVLSSFKKDAENISGSDNAIPESLGHYLKERFDDYLYPLVTRTPKEKKMMEAIFHWDNRWVRIDNACDSLNKLSVARWGDFHPCKGHYNMNPNINYCEELVEAPSGHYKRHDGSYPVLLKCNFLS
ncbi:putative polyamine oxidase 4, partial [Armadillidium vulgare]